MGVQNTIWHRSFLHSWTITGFVIRLTRRVPLVKQEQLTFLEHPSSVPVFSGVCVTRSLVLCVCFVDDCLSFCPFLPLCCLSFDLRILITPFGFGILKLFLRKAVIHFPIGSYVKNCHCRGAKTLCCSLFILFWGNLIILIQNFPKVLPTGQKDKQWSTKHTHKTKDRVTKNRNWTWVLEKGKLFLLH
jgi:hypothetical protein